MRSPRACTRCAVRRTSLRGPPALPAARSHHGADLPWHELVVAQSMQLAAGAFTGGNIQHELKNALTCVGNALFAVDDLASVEVHVRLHAVEHGRVGRQLE